MTKQEFYNKFGLKFRDIIEEYAFLSALDKLYLEFTPEQAFEVVAFFYANADDIFNDAQAAADQYIRESAEKIRKLFDDKNDEEDEEALDKVYDA